MKSIRIMIFGIGLILFGIFCKLMAIDRIYAYFWEHYFPIGVVIVGILCLVIGLSGIFEEDEK